MPAFGRGDLYIFYIAGDYFFEGPTYDNERVKIQDQAKRMYKSIRKQAGADKNNSYVIFFDPIGSCHLFGNKARIESFKKGKRIQSKRFCEIDMTSPENYRKLNQLIAGNFSREDYDKTMVYYYGEHISLRPANVYDLGNINNRFDMDLFVEGLSKLEEIEEVDHLVLHTCYNLNKNLIAKLHGNVSVKYLTGSMNSLPRAASNISALKGNEPLSTKIRKFSSDNNRGSHPFTFNQVNVKHLAPILEKIDRAFGKVYRRADYLDKLIDTRNFLLLNGPNEEVDLIDGVKLVLPESQEVLVNYDEFVRYSSRYLTNINELRKIYIEHLDVTTQFRLLNINLYL